MDKSQAIQQFWSSFGIPAYDEQTVPETAIPPYITYEVRTSKIGNAVSMSASVWYHSRSWADVTKKASEVAVKIGHSGIPIKIDDGYLWIRQSSVFAQRMHSESSDYRRILLNIETEFLTNF